MGNNILTYAKSDLTPRETALFSKDYLENMYPELLIEKFSRAYSLPVHSTKTINFRRMNKIDYSTAVLVEGVTPLPNTASYTDIEVTAAQYGDYIEFTDVLEATHTDPVLKHINKELAQSAAQMIETLRWEVLLAGTNVYRANGTARTDINTVVNLNHIRQVTELLKRNNAKMVTSALKSSAAFNTENVEKAYIALCSTDLESDIREIKGFVNAKNYASTTPYTNEIGSVENVRFLTSPFYTAWADAGGLSATNSTLSTTGTQSNVYPILIFGQDAYATIPIRGFKGSSVGSNITPLVVMPGATAGDPLGQRGTTGYKVFTATVIIYQLAICRLEVAKSDLGA